MKHSTRNAQVMENTVAFRLRHSLKTSLHQLCSFDRTTLRIYQWYWHIRKQMYRFKYGERCI